MLQILIFNAVALNTITTKTQKQMIVLRVFV